MFKAVLFDLDNTLIDFMKMKRSCSESAVSAMVNAGLETTEKKALEILFEMYEEHGMENQSIFEKFLKQVSGKVDPKILASGIVAYRRVKSGHLVPYPHVQHTLIKLKEKGIKLGIVTDAPRKQAWLRLAELNLTEFFDVVVTLEDTGRLKPSKMPFKQAINHLFLKPEEILFVGDNPRRDIAGAKKVGMKTALAEYGLLAKSKKTVKSDFYLKDISDLIKIVA